MTRSLRNRASWSILARFNARLVGGPRWVLPRTCFTPNLQVGVRIDSHWQADRFQLQPVIQYRN
jgi:hypothetical protein